MSRKPYMVRSYLINPKEGTIKPVTFPRNNLDAIYELLGCSVMEFANLADGHSVIVDEEGLILSHEKHFFIIEGYPQPLCNNALIVGPTDASGNTTHCKYTDQWFKDHPVEQILAMTRSGIPIATKTMRVIKGGPNSEAN